MSGTRTNTAAVVAAAIANRRELTKPAPATTTGQAATPSGK